MCQKNDLTGCADPNLNLIDVIRIATSRRSGGSKRITIVGSLVSFFPRIFNYFATIRVGSGGSPEGSGYWGTRLLAGSLAVTLLLPVLYAATFTIGGGAPKPEHHLSLSDCVLP